MPAQTSPAAQTADKPRMPEGDMSITINDPQTGEAVTPSMAVSGNYYCPQTPTPFIKCVLKPDGGGDDVSSTYLNYSNGSWEAYFESVSAGGYTAKAIIKHDKDSTDSKHTTVSFSVQTDPGLTTTTPPTGTTEPVDKSFPVKGTVDSEYANSNYFVSVYLVAGGAAITTPQQAYPDGDGKWSTDVNMPNDETEADIHADLWQVNGTEAITESVIGKITIG